MFIRQARKQRAHAIFAARSSYLPNGHGHGFQKPEVKKRLETCIDSRDCGLKLYKNFLFSESTMIPGKDWIGKYCLSQEVIKIAFNEMKKELLIIYFESEEMQPSLVRCVDQSFQII